LNDIRLWLLAHQDDEVLGLHFNSKSARNYVVYLTDGVRTDAAFSSNVRVAEAKRAWNRLDPTAELNFLGTRHAIKDGMLAEQLNPSHLTELISICKSKGVNEIVSLELEGGHQDHDVTSLLAEELSKRLSLKLYVFPAYRALHQKYPFYAVMSSLTHNDNRMKKSLTARVMLAKLSFSMMRNYKTQFTTWVGLGPFVIIRYLFGHYSYLIYAAPRQKEQIFPTYILYSIRNVQTKLDYHKLKTEISKW
jgi:LmbE family N-acetylglucosaminyl deacetylase